MASDASGRSRGRIGKLGRRARPEVRQDSRPVLRPATSRKSAQPGGRYKTPETACRNQRRAEEETERGEKETRDGARGRWSQTRSEGDRGKGRGRGECLRCEK